MRFLIINHLQNAHQSMRASRVRNFLTMLGVIIGVASITTILALSSGASRIIANQVDALNGNIAVIRPGSTTDKYDLSNPQTQNNYIASTLTESDIAKVKAVKNVKSIAPLMILNMVITTNEIKPLGAQIVATTPELADISNLSLREGQFLDNDIDQNTIVLGTQLSIRVFGTESSIGRTLTIHNQSFTVIGVLKRTDSPINYNLVDLDNAAIVNFTVGKTLNQGLAQIQQINIKANTTTNLDQVVIKAYKALLQNHGGENNFSILTGDQISQPTNQFFNTITSFMAVIAVISLIVGGIGIMNIMLMTVAERTREIGIRKALGASSADISCQFLIESLVISISGGIIGYVVGYIAAFGISNFLTFKPVINWQIAVVAVITSVVIGTLFGLYPAIRAARKDPIESLNQHN